MMYVIKAYKALRVKFSADDMLKYFSYFSHKSFFFIFHCMETICMKCQILFFGKNKKYIMNLSSAEFAVKMCTFQCVILPEMKQVLVKVYKYN